MSVLSEHSVLNESSFPSNKEIPSENIDLLREKSDSLRKKQFRDGLICSLCSMIFYSISVFLLRWMTDYKTVDHHWTLFFKELVTVAFILPLILCLCLRKKYHFPKWRWTFCIILGSLACSGIGARAHMYAFELVGLVITVPLIQSAQIIGTILLGLIALKESVDRQKIKAGIVLIIAILLLSLKTTSFKPLENEVLSSGLSSDSAVCQKVQTEKIQEELSDMNSSVLSEKIFDENNIIKGSIVEENAEKNIEKNNFSEEFDKRKTSVSKNVLWTSFWGTFIAILAGLAYSFNVTCLHFSFVQGVHVDRFLRKQNNSLKNEMDPQGNCVSALTSNQEKRTPGFFSVPLDNKTIPVPISWGMLLGTGVGMIVFGSVLFFRQGFQGFYYQIPDVSGTYTPIPLECWQIVFLSGLTNMIGFYFQLNGLRLASAAKVSLIAAGQILVLTLLGIFFFGEQTNFLVWSGLVLTIYGLFLSGNSK